MNSEERGERAERILGDPVFQEAVEALEVAYTDEWRNSHDADVRDECWRRVTTLRQIVEVIEGYVSDGKISQAKRRGATIVEALKRRFLN